ncbi:hypothetical protein ES708_16056 [subsurface metagenome]
MLPGDRLRNWIDGLANAWKDRLRGWMASWVMKGVEATFDFFEPDIRAEVKPSLQRLRDIPGLPEDIKAILDKAMAEPKAIQFAVLLPYLIAVMVGFAMGSMQPAMRMGGYGIDLIMRSARLDPHSVITAWRRDKPAYEKYFDDLRSLGWSDDRIEALKFVTQFYPAPADLIRWQAREVFEPEMIERYGLDSEFGAIDKEPFYKAGMTDEQILNYWRAHWEHASWMQVVEMLHRGLLTEEQVWDWFRVVEIPPYWRQHLIDTAYAWPTRVDVRRWWDMRTIDETELRRLYSGMGYRGVNLDNYILWTKVYVAFPDLLSRWSNGWISLDDVRSELAGLGMPAARVEEMIETKIKSTEPGRVSGERDLTKTDIYKGVKQGRITRGEAIELLVDLGFDEDEADYLLAINIPVDQEDTVVAGRALTKADIYAGLKAELLTEPEALDRLLELRYVLADAEFLLSIWTRRISPPVEAGEREASKADITTAVKKGLVTPEEGYLLLLDIGFTPAAAEFILMVRAETSPFSPANYQEFKELTRKYRIAAGREAKPMSEELKAAGAEVVKLTAEVKALQKAIAAEGRTLIANKVLPPEVTAKRDELRVSLHRAESALAVAQADYDSRLAEWRHGV